MCGQITMGCMSPPESNSIETRRLQQQHSRHISAPQFISEPTTNPRWLAELTARKELSAGAFDARQETVKLINHGHMHLNAIWQINHSSLVYWWGGCQIDVCSLHKTEIMNLLSSTWLYGMGDPFQCHGCPIQTMLLNAVCGPERRAS